MAKFIPTCRQCFHDTGQSITLVEKEGVLVCPKNPNHIPKNDVMVA